MPTGVYERKNAGGGGTVKRLVPAAAAPATSAFAAPGARRCGEPGCTGVLEPSVDRSGQSIDECSKCGKTYRAGSAPTPRPSAGSGARSCAVKGCPGRLDERGNCECCARRAAFVEQHTPTVTCEICGGKVKQPRANTKYCKACKPVASRIQTVQSHAKARKMA